MFYELGKFNRWATSSFTHHKIVKRYIFMTALPEDKLNPESQRCKTPKTKLAAKYFIHLLFYFRNFSYLAI